MSHFLKICDALRDLVPFVQFKIVQIVPNGGTHHIFEGAYKVYCTANYRHSLFRQDFGKIYFREMRLRA